jgi:hypothetical protein
MKLPHAFKGLRLEYISVAKLLEDDSYLDMTEGQFVGAVMKMSGGSMNPHRASEIWRELMIDAGFQLS